MTRPLGDAVEDVELWWQAYRLAENDQAGEFGERAEAGDEHARRQLASWLADRGYTRGIADRARLGEPSRSFARWLTPGMMSPGCGRPAGWLT